MYINTQGIIEFELPHISKKHEAQSEWKRTAMVLLCRDMCEYYAWFIRRRYHLTLYYPARGPHITFIADRFTEFKGNDDAEREQLWNTIYEKYQGKTVNIQLNPDVRTDGNHWWLNVPEEHRIELHGIRSELGLGRPHWGLHMTVGRPNEKNITHSRYLQNLASMGLLL